MHVNIGYIGYLFASLAFAALTLLLIVNWKTRRFGYVVITASTLSCIWAVISAISFSRHSKILTCCMSVLRMLIGGVAWGMINDTLHHT